MASRQAKFHGRVEGARAQCAVPGCGEPGEYKAPLQPANFDGPGDWRFLCLDHVREHNARYNFFTGMSPEEISEAQSPIAGWERPSRPFAALAGIRRRRGATSPIRSTPSARALPGAAARRAIAASTAPSGGRWRCSAWAMNSDRHALRQRYSMLVRRYHPDKNGGDRSHERKLGEVIDAYQLLRKSAAFA